LNEVIELAAAGTVQLSRAARMGTGLGPDFVPDWRDSTSVPNVDSEHDPRFLDAASYCASRHDPAADPGQGVGRQGEHTERRAEALRQLAQVTGETLPELIDRLAREGWKP